MRQLVLLLAIVFGTYIALTALQRMIPGVALKPSLRGRLSLSLLFLVTGATHFVQTDDLAQMLPAFIPLRIELVYLTGVLEILGAVGLLIPRLAHLTAAALVLFLLAVLPANIYAAFASVEVGGHAAGPIYLLARVPFQLFLIWWAYRFGLKPASASPGDTLTQVQTALRQPARR